MTPRWSTSHEAALEIARIGPIGRLARSSGVVAWKRRGTNGAAHAFVDGAQACGAPIAPVRFGSGLAARDIQTTDVSPRGRPYGRVCKWCDSAVARRRKGRS
jgi:hypothetical protein